MNDTQPDLFSCGIHEPPIPLSKIELKALIRHRDGYRCTECGMLAEEHLAKYNRTLDVHRLVPGSAYTLNGCVTLCRPYHKTKPKSPRCSRPKHPTKRAVKLHPEFWQLLEELADENQTSVNEELTNAIRLHITEHKALLT